MFRLEYSFNEADGELRKESIVVDKTFVTLADDDSVDIRLNEGASGKFTIEEAKNGQVTIRQIEDENLLMVNGQTVHAAELRDGDVITIDEVEFTYFYIVPPQAITMRSSSPMQMVSLVSIGLLLAAQAVFLIWVMIFWRLGQTPLLADETSAPPTQVAEAKSVDLPSPSDADNSAPETSKATPKPPSTTPVKSPLPQPTVTPKVGEPVPAESDLTRVESPPTPTPTPTPPTEPPSTGPKATMPPVFPDPEPEPSIATPELPSEPAPEPARPVIPNVPETETVQDKPAITTPQSPETMLLRSAQDQIAKGNLIRADDYYKLLQRSNPSYLPAYSDRARLFEKRGMLEESIDQWAQLKAKSENETIWSTLATKEHKRIEERLRALKASLAVQADTITTPISTKPTPSPNANPSATTESLAPETKQKYLEIISAEAPQMGSGDNYDYMRILSIEFASLPAGHNLRGEDVIARIQFYDQDRNTRRIYPSEIYVPRTEFTLSGQLPAGKVHSITCPYTVPVNFREKQLTKTKQNLTYYGFTVELFYVGHLQDYVAKPLSLGSRIQR